MMQPPPYGSSYDQLVARLQKQVHDQNLDGKILELLQSGFESALKQENLTLARPERDRLSQTILIEVLNKVTEQINKGKHA